MIPKMGGECTTRLKVQSTLETFCEERLLQLPWGQSQTKDTNSASLKTRKRRGRSQTLIKGWSIPNKIKLYKFLKVWQHCQKSNQVIRNEYTSWIRWKLYRGGFLRGMLICCENRRASVSCRHWRWWSVKMKSWCNLSLMLKLSSQLESSNRLMYRRMPRTLPIHNITAMKTQKLLQKQFQSKLGEYGEHQKFVEVTNKRRSHVFTNVELAKWQMKNSEP